MHSVKYRSDNMKAKAIKVASRSFSLKPIIVCPFEFFLISIQILNSFGGKGFSGHYATDAYAVI